MIKIIRKEKQDNKKRNYKIIIIAALLSMMLIGGIIYSVTSFIKPKAEMMPYIEFCERLEKCEIASASIDKVDLVVRFELKDDDTHYKTNYPESEDFTERLLLSGADVKLPDENIFGKIMNRLSGILLSLIMVSSFGFMLYLVGSHFGWFDKDEEDPQEVVKLVRFRDIVGLDEIKKDLLFIVSLMKNERKINARIPKGILLEGPPGNGKTMLAKAISNEAGVSFIAVNGGDLSNKYFGETGRKIRTIFEDARKNAPCILFIDEIDALGCGRTADVDSALDKEMNNIVDTFLGELDGMQTGSGVVVIAATNMADSLDPALIRPGRFDKRFFIPNPDRKARIELVDTYLDFDGIDVDSERAAKLMRGFSCAEIENTVNEAKLIAVKNGRSKVYDDDLDEAIKNHLVKGFVKYDEHEKRFDEKEIRAVSVHEAGHAVAAHYYNNYKVVTVSTDPTTSGAGGYTQTEGGSESDIVFSDDLFGEIVILLSGRTAELMEFGGEDGISLGSDQDISRATDLAMSLTKVRSGIDYASFGKSGIDRMIEEVSKILDMAHDESEKVLTEHKDALDKITDELIENGTISQERFAEIVA